ncbi:PepSY-like domain-containing protein [Bacteroidota bacterium]
MKNYIFTFLLFFSFAYTGYAQEVMVQDTILPEKIAKDFSKRYPKGTTDDWRKENENYIISYFENNNWFDVSYSISGKWEQTAILIDYEALPKVILKHFESSKYTNLEVVKITVSEKPKSEKQYKIYLETIDQKEKILIYSSGGTLISE